MARGRDPYWLDNVKYPARCAGCGAQIPRRARAFYYPNERTMLCAGNGPKCGQQAARDFGAALADERMVSGSY